MPYVDPSWRMWPQVKWLSKALCLLGRHHWLMSRSLKDVPVTCVVCRKRSEHYEEYARTKFRK